MIDSVPRFLNGAFAFQGQGYEAPGALHPSLAYTVPADKRAQMIYLRAGNSSAELVFVSLVQDGKPVRLFPLGAKAAAHVPLAVVEDLQPDSRIEIHVGAPVGVTGTIVIDLGLIEI